MQPQTSPHKHPARVAVVGSCCTRDAFNSLFVPDYKEHFDVCFQAFQQPLATLMEPPASIPLAPNSFADTNPRGYHEWMVLRPDLDKRALQMLAFKQPDLIVFDFYADTLYGVRGLANTTLVGGNPAFAHSALLPPPSEQNLLLPIHDFPAYARIFRTAAREFAAFHRAYLPRTRLVVNQTRMRDRYIAPDTGETRKHGTHTDAWTAIQNRIWSKLDAIFISETGADAIAHPQLTLNPEYRYGGPGYVHYTDETYQRFSRALRELHGADTTQSPPCTPSAHAPFAPNCIPNPAFQHAGAGWTYEGRREAVIINPGYATVTAAEAEATQDKLISDPIEISTRDDSLILTFDLRLPADYRPNAGTVLVTLASFTRTRIPLDQAHVTAELSLSDFTRDTSPADKANHGWIRLTASVAPPGPWVRVIFHPQSEVTYSLTNVKLTRAADHSALPLGFPYKPAHQNLPRARRFSRRCLTAAAIRKTRALHERLSAIPLRRAARRLVQTLKSKR